jgi:hypothetical protein
MHEWYNTCLLSLGKMLVITVDGPREHLWNGWVSKVVTMALTYYRA